MRAATNDVDACQTALKKWLTDKAEEHLIPWLKRISDEIGLSYSAVLIRQQQTPMTPMGQLFFTPPD